jgi:methionyl aminopeptidase
MTKLIGRNQPCWCGSGQKYKKCHQASDASLPADVRSFERNVARHLAEIAGFEQADGTMTDINPLEPQE